MSRAVKVFVKSVENKYERVRILCEPFRTIKNCRDSLTTIGRFSHLPLSESKRKNCSP